MNTNDTPKTSSDMAHSKARIKDFFEATELFDSRGFEIQDTYATGLLRAYIDENHLLVTQLLEQAFAQLNEEADHVQWLRSESKDRAKALIHPSNPTPA